MSSSRHAHDTHIHLFPTPPWPQKIDLRRFAGFARLLSRKQIGCGGKRGSGVEQLVFAPHVQSVAALHMKLQQLLCTALFKASVGYECCTNSHINVINGGLINRINLLAWLQIIRNHLAAVCVIIHEGECFLPSYLVMQAYEQPAHPRGEYEGEIYSSSPAGVNKHGGIVTPGLCAKSAPTHRRPRLHCDAGRLDRHLRTASPQVSG